MSRLNCYDLGSHSQDARGCDQWSCSKISRRRQRNSTGVRVMTYADTPMFSKIPAVATISFAVVKPNLYSQGATGFVPTPAMAPSRVMTCACSVCPIDFKSDSCCCERPSA